MKIRVECCLSEVQQAVEKLGQVFAVKSVSKPYKGRGNDNVRVYIEVAPMKGERALTEQECLDWIFDLMQNDSKNHDDYLAYHDDVTFTLADLLWHVANSTTKHISICIVSKTNDPDSPKANIIYDGPFKNLSFYTVREYSDLEVLAFAGDCSDMRILLDGTKLPQ